MDKKIDVILSLVLDHREEKHARNRRTILAQIREEIKNLVERTEQNGTEEENPFIPDTETEEITGSDSLG